MNDMHSTLRAGHVIHGHYRVVDLLGQGASGAVYLVKDERNHQKRYALKEVMHAVREERRGFPFDAAALERLDHPALAGIDRVLQGMKRDRFYMLTDYVEGYNLEAMRQLMPGKRFSFHTAMTLMSPILDAVSYLHHQHPPLIHGDIKPSNIIAPNPGTLDPAKLVDFGGGKNACTDATAQQGTLNYRAPEQYGGKASRRTDIYALGATFYTLLTGAVPPAASDRLARIDAGEPDPLLPMSHFMPSGHTVNDAINCALSVRRHDRFASVEQFRAELWQVIHAYQGETHLPEPTAVVPAGEQSEPPLPEQMDPPLIEETKTGPDDTVRVVHIAASIGNGAIQAAVHSTAASSGPPLAPAIPAEGPLPVEVSWHGGSPVLRRRKRRKRKARTLSRVVLVLFLVCIIGSGVATAGYQMVSAQYQKDAALTQVGVTHLQTALSLLQTWSKTPLGAPSVTPAQREFAAAYADFAQLDADVQSAAGVSAVLPAYGPRVRAAFHLVPIAMEVARAGIVGCAALNVILSRLHEPFGASGGLSLGDLATIGNDFHRVEADVNQAIAQINALQPGDVQSDARVGKAIAALHHSLPSVQAVLRQADNLLPALPALLGVSAPAYYLVELLDSTQLRPGGGVIKDYGYAGFIGGRLSAAYITDAHLLDNSLTHSGRALPLPPAYRWFQLAPNGWNLRDSNLDADFPTAAGYAEQNYTRAGGRVPLQGVIAITFTFMANALAITGPISVPELHETVTAHNLVDRIHYYEPWLGGRGGSILAPGAHAAGSRYFTQLLAKHFLARFHQVRSTALAALFQMLVSSLRTKDLQIYFGDAPAENLLRLSHIDAAIPPSTGDSLFVVDANVAADNANQYITGTVDDRVSIDGSGNATHHTAIRYAWGKNGPVFGSPLYSDYVRVYVPPGSLLQGQQGWQPGGASEAFDREVWAGSFTLSPGQIRTVTLTWTEKGVAKKDAAGWHYRYLIQRQAGSQWGLNVQVTVPSCAVRTRPSGGLTLHNGHTATLTRSLSEDTNLGIDYSC